MLSFRLCPAIRCAALIIAALLCSTLLIPYCDGAARQRQQKSKEEETIRLGNLLVTLNVSVSGKDGRAVLNLTRENFEVFEDDKRQAIVFFGQEDQPISFGLLFDRSKSMGEAGKLRNARAAALSFLRAGNPQNEAFCMAFNETVELISDFTPDYGKIESAMGNLEAGGGTALYDAIISGLERLQWAKHKRRALVVITDGGDQQSRHTLAELIARVERSNAQVYTIGFFDKDEAEIYKAAGPRIQLVDGRGVDNPRFVFKALAEETGAETFFPRSEQELNKVISDILSNLRRQYVLAYYPMDQRADERYRNIKVKIRGAGTDGLGLKTRKGYRMSRPEVEAGPEDVTEKARLTGAISSSLNLPDEQGSDEYRERFDNPSSGLPNTKDSFYKNGKYHLLGNRIVTAGNYLYSDFEASVTVELLPESNMANTQNIEISNARELPTAGLCFRINPDGYYTFSIAPTSGDKGGYYRLTKLAAGKQVDLISLKYDTAIRRRSRIRVRCIGPQIELYANDMRLAVVKDDYNIKGRVAIVFAGKHAVFDDLVIKRIK